MKKTIFALTLFLLISGCEIPNDSSGKTDIETKIVTPSDKENESGESTEKENSNESSEDTEKENNDEITVARTEAAIECMKAGGNVEFVESLEVQLTVLRKYNREGQKEAIKTLLILYENKHKSKC